MTDWLIQHAGSIGAFLAGFIGGGATGCAITYNVTRNKVTSGDRVVDQSRARAGGDNVGGNKTTIGRTD
jgi:hypothetical protein